MSKNKSRINKERIYDSMLDTINRNVSEVDGLLSEKVSTSDIVDNLTSNDTNKPLSANQGKVLNDTTAKLAVSNTFTQPQQVPNATLPQHATNKLQVETMFEMFKRELRGYNLASPDLTGKEHLGNGVYRLYNDYGITIDYNVYNGIYAINGTVIYYSRLDLINVLPNTEYTASYIAVSGTLTGRFSILVITPTIIAIRQDNQNINKQNTFITNDTQTTLIFEALKGATFDNFMFKLQLEKGDTATPYTVPGEIPAYKIVGEE